MARLQFRINHRPDASYVCGSNCKMWRIYGAGALKAYDVTMEEYDSWKNLEPNIADFFRDKF